MIPLPRPWGPYAVRSETISTPETSGSVLDIEDIGPVRRLTMNRPEALNALNGELIESMQRALSDAAADDAVRVLILRGAGRAFCSGYDLNEDANAGTKDSQGWYAELKHSADDMLAVLRSPEADRRPGP